MVAGAELGTTARIAEGSHEVRWGGCEQHDNRREPVETLHQRQQKASMSKHVVYSHRKPPQHALVDVDPVVRGLCRGLGVEGNGVRRRTWDRHSVVDVHVVGVGVLGAGDARKQRINNTSPLQEIQLVHEK